MVKRTLEIFECDVCGEEAERYVMQYPDGTLTLDRCHKHDAKIKKLREEDGAWTTKSASGRAGFKVSTVEDIKRQL